MVVLKHLLKIISFAISVSEYECLLDWSIFSNNRQIENQLIHLSETNLIVIFRPLVNVETAKCENRWIKAVESSINVWSKSLFENEIV